jgi:hypothetical protein
MRCNGAGNLYSRHLTAHDEYLAAPAIAFRQETLQIPVSTAVDDGDVGLIDAKKWNSRPSKEATSNNQVVEVMFLEFTITRSHLKVPSVAWCPVVGHRRYRTSLLNARTEVEVRILAVKIPVPLQIMADLPCSRELRLFGFPG